MTPSVAISDASLPARCRRTHTVELDDEAVVLDLARNRLHRLNPPAALIWRCLDDESTFGDLVTDLAEAVGVPTEVVRSQAAAVLEQLRDEGLVHW
ncbi:MAG: PqqD family protein [Acidimicrobiales bacterium]